MKKILVVGGAGYIGSHTVAHLQKNGYDVVVADNLHMGHAEAIPSGVPLEQVDLLDQVALAKLFQKYHFHTVLHFAALIHVYESVSNPSAYYRNNALGTLNLLDAMRAADVDRIVFSSSCAVYGKPSYLPLDENHPRNPFNAYGQSKLMAEIMLADHARAHGLRWIALRYFNAAGSGDGMGESHEPETHLVPLVLRAIVDGQPISLFGTNYDTPDGTCIRDYVHVEDLARAHLLAMENLKNFSGAINLGTGVGTSVREIIVAAERVTGRNCPVRNVARRSGDSAQFVASNDMARKILGWIPSHGIDAMIADAWHWEQHRKY
ncbi:MAG: UDP-glucose 4-epimerase GalE [Puniceicoccales bacterium]|jgi:UDP-glucose 4-epimerase|nr:UDP-glucose 4-epimerase GalE [Puniceicoccales bacterium]